MDGSDLSKYDFKTVFPGEMFLTDVSSNRIVGQLDASDRK